VCVCASVCVSVCVCVLLDAGAGGCIHGVSLELKHVGLILMWHDVNSKVQHEERDAANKVGIT
jgi:hypothetical protein